MKELSATDVVPRLVRPPERPYCGLMSASLAASRIAS